MPDPGGGGSETTTVQQQLDPAALALQQQALQMQQDFYNKIWGGISSEGPYYYPGLQVAPLAPQSLMANQMTTQAFSDPNTYSSTPIADLMAQYVYSGAGLPVLAQQAELGQFLASPQGIDPTQNPFTAAAADAAARQTVSTLSNQILPQIRSEAVSAGQFGGSRQGIAEGHAIAGAAQAISDTISKTYFDQYNQNIKAALQSQALTPGTVMAPLQMAQAAIDARGVANQQMMAGFAALDAAGLQLQQQAQAIIDAEIQQYMFNNTIGLEELKIFAGIGGALTSPAAYGSGGTTTTTGPASGVSPLQGAAGGALTGYTVSGGQIMGALIGGAIGLFGSYF